MNDKPKKFSLIFWIVVGLFIGTMIGGFFPKAGEQFSILGEIFMNLLKMMVIPLVMVSLITGVTSLGDIKKIGAIGRRTFVYYMVTTAISVLLGLVLVNIIKPGCHTETKNNIPHEQVITSKTIEKDRDVSETLKEILLGDKVSGKEGFIPRNVFNAIARGDVLPIIFFSLLISLALSTLGRKAKGFISGINVLNETIMKMVHWIIMVAPIGVFGLIAGRIGKAGGFVGFYPELQAIGSFFFTVLLGLTIHFVLLSFILKIFGKRNPIQYLKGMRLALLNGFSTDSSSATIPFTMECVEKNNHISNRTSSFVIPLGATINMDGTALYEAVSALFIAQLYGIDLTMTQQCIVFLTSTLAAIGAAGIPEAGLVTMVIVLKAVNLPTEGIALLLTVDWLLDRFRTITNIWGDCVGAAVVERLGAKDVYKPEKLD